MSSSAASARAVSSPSSRYRLTGDGATSTSPRNTSPVDPSIATTSPSWTTCPSALKLRVTTSMSSASAPTTHVRPMPRATTAACDVLPPRAVSTPTAAIMPPRSSGFVSRRTSTTSLPSAAHSCAVGESKTAIPTAAPGEAAIPRASRVRSAAESNCGNSSCVSCSPETRASASSSVIRCSSTSCVAIRNAAAAVRLPTRVCSIHSRPRSIVNSMSHRSR